MSRQYNPRTTLRQIPNTLLQRFFSDSAEFHDLDWTTLDENEVEPLFERWQAMSEPERRRVEMILRQVHALADGQGTAVLIEAARDNEQSIAEELSSKQNSYERAFWCFLEYPNAFKNARSDAYIKALPRTSWETRNGFRAGEIKVTEAVSSALGRQLSEFYKGREGRGDVCKVEYRPLRDGIHLFHAYPSDYADEIAGYDEDNEFVRLNWKSFFEVVFCYDSSAGSLDLYAKGGGKIRDVLCGRFSLVVLGERDPPKPPPAGSYDLDLFKNPEIDFPTDIGDNIAAVRVTGIRLQFHNRPRGRVTFEVDSRSAQESVYALVVAKLNPRRARLEEATVVGVTLEAVFRVPGQKDQSVDFDISRSHCNLGDKPEERLLRRYLRTWKIERDE